MFETQPTWRINKNDIELVQVYSTGDTAYLHYKVGMTSKVNMYTTVSLDQCIDTGSPSILQKLTDTILGTTTVYGSLNPVVDTYEVAYYKHVSETNSYLTSWHAYVYWTHYYFGDIMLWNTQHNVFKGDVVMSFDIAQSPLPNFQTISGDNITKNFDYIAVSSAGVVSNTLGKLNNTAPTIVGLTPREYDSGVTNFETHDDTGAIEAVNYKFNPNIQLTWDNEPDKTWDGHIIPQSAGSSLNPTTKDGLPIWNATTQKSMTDCKLHYNLQISPYVEEYYATLSYYYQYLKVGEQFFWQGPFIKDHREQDYSWSKPIAIQCTNRYDQTEIKVVFDIYASYNIDVKADGIEDFILSFPEEYYNALLWLTTVEGFGGGTQYTASSDPLQAFANWIMDFFSNILSWLIQWIIPLLILAIVIVVFIYVVVPYLRARASKKK